MPAPDQLGKIQFSSLSLPEQIQMSNIQDRINHLLGYQGPIQLVNHLDLSGKRIMNVGAAESETDALVSGQAETRYSAAALKPKLQANSNTPLDTYRMLNNGTQRENRSSWLNNLMSTPPSASTVFPTITTVGSSVQVSIPPSVFTFADGATVNLQGRVDLLALPAQYAITGLTVTNGIVTCHCGATGLVSGELATIIPGSNATYAGTFQVVFSSGGGSTLQVQNQAASGSDSSGFVQVGSVWYYSLKIKSRVILLTGPFSTDTSQNRLGLCADGSQIVAVVTVTATGAQISNTGGGGTPLTGAPASGSFF